MKKDFIIEYIITEKGDTHFTDSGDEDFLTAMVVDHKNGKLRILRVDCVLSKDNFVTIYDENKPERA